MPLFLFILEVQGNRWVPCEVVLVLASDICYPLLKILKGYQNHFDGFCFQIIDCRYSKLC